MNTKEQAYQDELNKLITAVKQLKAPYLAPAQATLTGERIPSATKKDLALVIQSELMLVQRGLADDYLDGVSICTYLASLLANEKGLIGSAAWQKTYLESLKSLGWQGIIEASIYFSAGESVEQRAEAVNLKIRCGQVNPLLAGTRKALINTPKANALFKSSSKAPDNEFLFRVTTVPTITTADEIVLGAVFAKTNTYIGDSLHSPENIADSRSRGFSVKLHLSQFEIMMKTVEPALRDYTRRRFEQIKL